MQQFLSVRRSTYNEILIDRVFGRTLPIQLMEGDFFVLEGGSYFMYGTRSKLVPLWYLATANPHWIVRLDGHLTPIRRQRPIGCRLSYLRLIGRRLN